ncbi:TauD/TfdA family dioxygenase [Micromonospora sp. AMSO12t]|uniref:TauD/TfdA family dioxygenase n=1 Tax=unclassified Micromonospora TaxID=2617518 RepID=UPI00124B8EAA|nr:TauD/TfdA family dioxygenase [Micromonospora sp. AMSO12t]KAB1162076.1 TauD/TfdA family dioxygenase [Micromonospora sp. AMSO12t]
MSNSLLPALIEVDDEPDIVAAIKRRRAELRQRLTHRGALLFRGFDVGGVDGFDSVVRALAGPPLTYSERSSPRSTIKGKVYTSTDYPPSEEIFLHNENSYQATWPRLLFFYCLQPAESLGATPLADTRAIYSAIHPDVREEFRRRRWMVVRNFHESFGQSWRQVFNTDERAIVEEYCRGRGIELEWRGNGLRTRAVRNAVHTHPDSGEAVWFNHATFFHVTTLAAEVQSGLRAIFGDEDLPTNTYFGDGASIPDETLDHLRSCYRSASTRFDYELNDVLVVDNMLVAHGRESFTGPRRVAVAMAEPSV